MATPQTKTTRRRSARARASRKSTGAASLDRLNASLEAAQKALTDLGDNLGRGGRDLLKDVQKMVRDARRDTLRLNKSLLTDLDQLQKAVTGRGGRSQASKKSRTTRKVATRKAASGRTASTRSSRSTTSRRAARK
jgi:ABC-type transporter Mla subunit MlaD